MSIKSSVHLVDIPPEVHKVDDYGNMGIGHVEKSGSRFVPVCWGLRLPSVKLRRDAVDAVKAHWHRHHSKWALARKWKDVSKSGAPVRFHHQTDNAIVASVYPLDGRAFRTSFSLSGLCSTNEKHSLIARD